MDTPLFAIQDVFTSAELCVLDKTMVKTAQFDVLFQKANTIMLTSSNLKFKDMLFFDNDAGNCKFVASRNWESRPSIHHILYKPVCICDFR
jgi:hypothetical protein